jgi:hypothetical protein
MRLFSEKYGYTKVSDIIIKEEITRDIQNAICSCYDRLERNMRYSVSTRDGYANLELYLWTNFLNKREYNFYRNGGHYIVATEYIENNNEWYNKLDIIEKTLSFLNSKYQTHAVEFAKQINEEFKRLNFAYRIINNSEIIEITSDNEIKAIENAINDSQDNIKYHLNEALRLYAQRPIGDYRNSIKESISAVEALTRNITDENTLNLKKMEKKGIILPSVLRKAFEALYGYTNDSTTGIRHPLMDATNAPSEEEAMFMLISCSAFINYINKKRKS